MERPSRRSASSVAPEVTAVPISTKTDQTHGDGSFLFDESPAKAIKQKRTVPECLILLDVLHLRGIARLGGGLFVGIADGEDVIQLVISGNVETIEEELTLLV